MSDTTDMQHISARSANSIAAALAEIKAGFRHWEYWLGLGWFDIRRRYVRTYLGPLWSVINALVFVAIVGTIYTFLFNLPVADLLPHLAAGYFVWLFVSGVLTESCSLLYSHGIVLKTSPIKPIDFVLRLVARLGFVFLHNFAILILIALFFSKNLATLPLAVIGIVLMFALAVPTALILGIVCVRFRFIQQIITNLILVIFFATPVLWKPDMLSGKARIFLEFNPLYHLIALIRRPTLGDLPPLHSLGIVIALTIIVWVVAVLLYARARTRLAFWY